MKPCRKKAICKSQVPTDDIFERVRLQRRGRSRSLPKAFMQREGFRVFAAVLSDIPAQQKNGSTMVPLHLFIQHNILCEICVMKRSKLFRWNLYSWVGRNNVSDGIQQFPVAFNIQGVTFISLLKPFP